MKQQKMISAYTVNTDTRHIVTIERLTNDANGNERYKAVIIFTESGDNNFFNAVYTLAGHYKSEQAAAEWIVREYERGR